MNRALALFAMLGWMFFALTLLQDRPAPADTTTVKSGGGQDDGGIASPNCPADIAPSPNGDGVVNVQDLLAVVGAWGQCPGGCVTAAQCDDGNPCTLDVCQLGQCANIPIQGCCQTTSQCPVVPNGSYVCMGNQCVFNGCDPGYSDCNGNLIDGCEVYLLTDFNNCGGCGLSADDGNPCTIDSCVNGQIIHQPAPANTPCPGGLCNGSGNCVPLQ